jgi:peroxiredoxin Q/BCP
MVVAGEPAPPFSLLDHRGRAVSLADYAGKRLLVYFYPRAFTPGCTTEACDLRDRHQAFLQAGWAVVGISPDPPERLARFREEHGLPFPLLSDPDHRVAEAYGAWGAKRGQGREAQGMIRSTFAVGPDGRVEAAWHNVRAAGHAEHVVSELGI